MGYGPPLQGSTGAISTAQNSWPTEEVIGDYEEIGEQYSLTSCLQKQRTLRITSHRIAIFEGDVENPDTVKTYWRHGLTEALIGPLEWSDPCCDLCPCCRRPREGQE